MARYRLGIVEVTLAPRPRVEAAALARSLGFDHLDVSTGGEEGALALPVVDRFHPSPRPGCTTGALPRGDGNWERSVRAFRRSPGARIEPWAGSIIDSIDAIRAFLDEAPGITLLLDTGHVANWGDDPVDLIDVASHIQLRQARRGVPQADEGDIDFRRFFAELRRREYAGALSVEYFDLPELGFPLDDPLGHALALTEQVRPLL